MSVKGLASPQLLAHNEAVIFTDHLFHAAYWRGGGKLKGGDWGSKGAVSRRGIRRNEKRPEKKMNVQLPCSSADVRM